MTNFKTILGITALSLICTASGSYALDTFTNTNTVDSTVLGPAWVDPANSAHNVMMSAVMGWKADPAGLVTPFGSGSSYIASKVGGLGALTSDFQGCKGPGDIQLNVSTTAGIYTGASLDGGSNPYTALGTPDTCGNFSNSPQSAPNTAVHNATGVIVQNINLTLASDDPLVNGDALDIYTGDVRFSMVAATHEVTDWGTTISQDTEIYTDYGSGTIADDVSSMVLTQSIGASSFTALADPTATVQAGARNFDLDVSLTQSMAIDLPVGLTTTGPSDTISLGVTSGSDTSASVDYNTPANMPPGFF